MSTKTFSLTLVICIICNLIRPHQAFELPDVVVKQVRKLHARCAKESKLSEEIATKANTDYVPDDPTFKCFLHCMFDFFGLIDHEQKMHLEVLLEIPQLPEEAHESIKKLVETCGTKTGIDGCDTAYQTVLCYLDTDKPFIDAALMKILG